MIPWITCREVVDFLDGYLTGALDPDATARFERHLSECPPCVAYMQTYQAATSMARAALRESEDAAEEMPEDLVKAVLRARGKGEG